MGVQYTKIVLNRNYEWFNRVYTSCSHEIEMLHFVVIMQIPFILPLKNLGILVSPWWCVKSEDWREDSWWYVIERRGLNDIIHCSCRLTEMTKTTHVHCLRSTDAWLTQFFEAGLSKITFPSSVSFAIFWSTPLTSWLRLSTDRAGTGAAWVASSASSRNFFSLLFSVFCCEGPLVRPRGDPAISFTSRSERTSLRRGPRDCTRIWAGPSNWRKSCWVRVC